MNTMPVASRSAAIAGVVLALPFATLFTLLVLRVEPVLGFLAPLVTVPPDQPNVIGTVIVFGAWLLAIVAFIINVRPVVRNARAGHGVTGDPTNLVVAAVSLVFVIAFVAALVIDQYPCWIGVPNCD